MIFRAGFGYDLHPLIPGRRMMLGGIRIPSETGEKGHSDGDVLIHAVVDALLGAIAAGDIGTFFPDSDPSWKNAESAVFLRKTLAILKEKYYSVVNIDTTIILETPKLRPFINNIRENLALITGLPVENISVKATTNEKSGPLGRGEAIACYAVVMVSKDGAHDRT